MIIIINISGQTWSKGRGDQEDSGKLAVGRSNIELHSYVKLDTQAEPVLLV